MKKFLTLVLVLALALGLSVPAMAFTSDSEADDDSVPYSLKIYLVEYEDNDLFGFATLPESDRGYAKNEIVAAVVELYVPDEEDPAADDYWTLVFGGDNVDLDVTDNYNDLHNIDPIASDNVADDGDVYIGTKLNADDEIEIRFNNLPGENTYKWLFFAKVTDDDASLYAKLIDGDGTESFVGDEMELTLDGIDYGIRYYRDGEDFVYEINVDDEDSDYAGSYIYIVVDEDNVSLGMSIDPYDDGTAFALGVNTKNELGVIDPSNPSKFLATDDPIYEDVMDIYNDVVVDVFGLDYFRIGNYVRDSYFEDLVSGDTLTATVDIEPWTAYVTVPDNIVVDPPKTGDAASIMGFVMVALSGAGVVALRKRG